MFFFQPAESPFNPQPQSCWIPAAGVLSTLFIFALQIFVWLFQITFTGFHLAFLKPDSSIPSSDFRPHSVMQVKNKAEKFYSGKTRLGTG